MFWLRNKKNNFSLRTLIWGPACIIKSTCMSYDQSSIEYVEQIPYIFQWQQENIQVSLRRMNQKKCSTRLRPQSTVLGLVKHGRTKRPPWLSLIKMELSFAFILCGYHG